MFLLVFFFFFKQKTAYEVRISDWSSDVCSSDLCPPLDGIDDNLSDLSCSTMPHTPAAACRACVNLFPPPVARSMYRRQMPWHAARNHTGSAKLGSAIREN